jgi:cytoskeletal protein RodZ
MSYILEALKKSEKKRQGEQNNLTRLATQETEDQKSAPVRRPVWPLLLGLALVINAVIMLLIFWPGQTPSDVPSHEAGLETQAPAPGAKTAAQSAPTAAAAPALPTTPLQDEPAVHKTSKAEAATTLPPSTTPAAEDSEDELAQTRASEQESSPAPKTATPAAPERSVEGNASAGTFQDQADAPIQTNSDDGENSPPLYRDLSSTLRGRIPELHMSVHAYSADPSGGLIRVNNKMLRPGAYLDDGLRLEAITRDGAVFSYAGQKFLLPRR